MTQQQQQWNQPAEDDVQMPLGVGGDAAVESTGGEDRKPKVSGPTLVLFGAFASALLIIYLVGMQNKTQSASAAQGSQNRPSAIAELLAKNGGAEKLQGSLTDTDTKKLVRLFYSYMGTQRAAIPHLSHDPFGEAEAPVVAANTTPDTPAITVNPENSAKLERLRKRAEEFKGLKLQSVMMGRTPIAIINNRMVQADNNIGEFTVTGIESNRVLLEYEGSTFELKAAGSDTDKP